MTTLQVDDEFCDPFYDVYKPFSSSSTNVIIYLIIKLVNLKYVIDNGCGTGEWLKVLEKFGIRY
jgi:hypothetical protein